MNIAVGSDHAGFEFKKTVLAWLERSGYEFTDMGPYQYGFFLRVGFGFLAI